MSFEDNLARPLPEPMEEALEINIPGTEAYIRHRLAWDPESVTDEEKEQLKSFESKRAEDGGALTDAEGARLVALRKKQINFGPGEGFNQDELAELVLLTEKEEKAKEISA